MNITKFDSSLLFITTLAVVLISFTGPVFGLTTADATDANDIPNLTVNEGTFDRLDGFPERPGNPSSGELVYTENSTTAHGDNTVYVLGDFQNRNGIEVILSKPTGTPTNSAKFFVYDWNSGTLESSWNATVAEGESVRYENQSQGLIMELSVSNATETYPGTGSTYTDHAEGRFQVVETPSDSGFFSNVPILGGIANGASELAGIVGWIGSIIFYLFLMAGETVINVFVILVNVTTYLISITGWLFGTYLSVVEGAGGWASVIVAVPGTIFAAMLAKFVAVGISLMPTT